MYHMHHRLYAGGCVFKGVARTTSTTGTTDFRAKGMSMSGSVYGGYVRVQVAHPIWTTSTTDFRAKGMSMSGSVYGGYVRVQVAHPMWTTGTTDFRAKGMSMSRASRRTSGKPGLAQSPWAQPGRHHLWAQRSGAAGSGGFAKHAACGRRER
jgi:hypothetical protein